MDWIEKLQELHVAREMANKYKKEIACIEEAHRTRYTENYAGRDDAVRHVFELEDEIRQAAVDQYAADPTTKEICPGVGIRVMTSYNYPFASAFDWAREHRLCLKLDEKAFKDMCKQETTRPAWVELVETPITTIAVDLGKVLGK